MLTDGERYWMLQILREYALERLAEGGEEDVVRAAHTRWCVEMISAARAGATLRTPALRGLVLRERENLLGALYWSTAEGDLETVAHIVAPLIWTVWVREGQLEEAQRWLRLVLDAIANYPPSLAADVFAAAGTVTLQIGELEQAIAYSERALSLRRELGDLEGIGWAMITREIAAEQRCDPKTARALMEETVAFTRQHGLRSLPNALTNLADLEVAHGHLDEARALIEEALDYWDESEPDTAIALINLAEIAALENQFADATGFARAAVETAVAQGDRLAAISSALVLAWPLAELGETAEAGLMLGAALEFLERSRVRRQRTEMACEASTLNALRRQLDEPGVSTLLQRGRDTPPDEALRRAVRIRTPSETVSLDTDGADRRVRVARSDVVTGDPT